MAARRTLAVKEIVGRGGFGTVYRATLEAGGGFRKDVAVKVIHEFGEASAQIAERLRDEARLLGLVRHRALPSVDGLYWIGSRSALVTEYVHGVSLLKATRRERLPIGVALEIGAEVASALHAAFTAPGPDGQPVALVHRDVKPANIQLTPAGEIKLLDFGIARADFEGREAETSEVLLGSVTYMSPERLELESGPGGDVYALGVTLAEAVTALKMARTSAHPERHGAYVDGVLARVRERHADPSLPAFLDVLRDMLAYDPADRPTAKELDRRLREVRRLFGSPWLAEWAEEHVSPEALPPSDDRFPDELTGRTFELADEPPAPPASSVPPSRLWSVLALAGVLGFLGVAAGVVALALGASVLWPTTGPPGPEPLVLTPPAPLPVFVPEPEPEPSVVAVAPVVAPAVAPVVAPAVALVVAPTPAPAPVAPLGEAEMTLAAAAAPASSSAFAAWLGQHAEWSPAQATADGRADALYLRGWTDGRPPASPIWALDVSFAAAEAFCAGRGGLADLAATPLSWDEVAGPLQEWRDAGGRPAWRRYDGATSTVVRRSEANGFTGMRCAR